MHTVRQQPKRVLLTPQPRSATALPLTDLRFAALVGADAWHALPPDIRARFAKRLGPGATASYIGTITICRMSRCGWLLGQAARLIGAPLPLSRDTGRAVAVSVTEDGASGGQVWSRMYARARGVPQVIHSVKRFAGVTGLEEYLGCGFGIALTVAAGMDRLRFTSDHYFWGIGRLRLRLPRWLSPGALTIDHIARGPARFDFALTLRHPLLGELMHQLGDFRDR